MRSNDLKPVTAIGTIWMTRTMAIHRRGVGADVLTTMPANWYGRSAPGRRRGATTPVLTGMHLLTVRAKARIVAVIARH